MCPVDLLSDEDDVAQEIEDLKSGKPEEEATEEEIFEDPDEIEDDSIEEKDFKEVDEEYFKTGETTAEEEEEETVEEEAKEEKEEVEVDENLEAIRKLIDTGEETLGKVKGEEVDFSKLTPKERLALQQKGYRFYQEMEELSQLKDNLRAFENELNRNAEQFIKLSQSGQLPGKPSGQQTEATMPVELQDNEYDDEKARALKAWGRSQWEQNQQLSKKVSTLESGYNQEATLREQKKIIDEVERVVEDYPVASKEEIIAIRAFNPQISAEKIARVSQKHYGSVDFVNKVFTHCPEVKRHFYEEFAKDLASKKTRTQRIARRPSSSSSKAVTEKQEKPKGKDYDWDDAKADALKRIRALKEIREEEDLE